MHCDDRRIWLGGERGPGNKASRVCRSGWSRVRGLRVNSLIVVAAALLGCSDTPVAPARTAYCLDDQPAFRIRIKDAQTGQYVAARTVVIARTGTYTDTGQVGDNFPDTESVAVGFRSGSYEIIVRKSGYADWGISGLVIPPNDAPCELYPGLVMRLEVLLQRLP
jgi:hypothetical protein